MLDLKLIGETFGAEIPVLVRLIPVFGQSERGTLFNSVLSKPIECLSYVLC